MQASMGDPPRQSKVYNLKSKLFLALLWIGLVLPVQSSSQKTGGGDTQFSCDPWSADSDSCPKTAISKEIRANVTATLLAVQGHEKAKKEVTDVLRTLSRKVEFIVVKKIEKEMSATQARIVGRLTIIGTAAASFFLTAPVVALSGVGYVIGYAIVGTSKIYEMQVKSEHKEDVARIHAELQEQLEKYTDSQSKVFDILDLKMALLTEGQDFKTNMNRIRNIVQEIEDTSEGLCFKELFLFMEKAKAKYISIPQDQKESLNTNDFLLKAKELMSNAENVVADEAYNNAPKAVGATILMNPTGATFPPNPTGATFPPNPTAGWSLSTFFHVGNLLVNGVFLVHDIIEYMELSEMRGEKWSANKIFNERPEEFGKEMELRDLIEIIRDDIMKSY